MGKVNIDLLFPDSYRLGDLPGGHLIFAQEIDDPLADCPSTIPIRILCHVRDREAFLKGHGEV
jgi:hypothetical protein